MSTASPRRELEDLIRRDLLGPAGGEQETITKQSVRNGCLLGMLAPLKVIEAEEEPFEELADSSEDNAKEGTADHPRQRNATACGHWSVTLFLSNEQEGGRPRDVLWLFQAELAVRGKVRAPSWAGERLEDQTNEMLYRRDVEFARRHC